MAAGVPVAAHRLTDSDSRRPTSVSRFVHQRPGIAHSRPRAPARRRRSRGESSRPRRGSRPPAGRFVAFRSSGRPRVFPRRGGKPEMAHVHAADLLAAVAAGDVARLRTTLPRTGDPAEDGPLDMLRGMTPLMVAAAFGNEAMVELLLLLAGA